MFCCCLSSERPRVAPETLQRIGAADSSRRRSSATDAGQQPVKFIRAAVESPGRRGWVCWSFIDMLSFHLVCTHVLTAFFPFLLGQVRQMHQEEEEEDDGAKLTHIRIPAAYSSGITFFALRESELGQELLSAPDLPLLWWDWHSWTRLIY